MADPVEETPIPESKRGIEQWTVGLKQAFFTEEEQTALSDKLSDKLIRRVISPRSKEEMPFPQDYPTNDKEMIDQSDLSSQPVCARWTRARLEEKYRPILSLDGVGLAGANAAAGLAGGDRLLRSIEKTLCEKLQIPEQLTRGEAPNYMVVSVGGDEYTLLQRKNHQSPRQVTIDTINHWLADKKVPTITTNSPETESQAPGDKNAIPTYKRGSAGIATPLITRKTPITWRSVTVKENTIPPDIEAPRNSGQYKSIYQQLLGLEEEEFDAFPLSTKEQIARSIYDPLLASEKVFQNPQDGLMRLNIDEAFAFVVSTTGLKEANTKGMGNDFIKEEYDNIANIIDEFCDSYEISREKVAVSRVGGSTFMIILDIDPQKDDQEVFAHVLRNRLISQVRQSEYTLFQTPAFPGYAYGTFSGKNQELLDFIQEVDITQAVELVSQLLVPALSADKLVYNRIESYLNEGPRSPQRRYNLSIATSILTHLLPNSANQLNILNKRYGSSRAETIRTIPSDHPLIAKIGTMLGIRNNPLEDDDGDN